MNRLLIIIGAIAGAAIASTPQGRKTIDDLLKRGRTQWRQPGVQRFVSDAQDDIRAKVPVVGDTIADAIDKTKPATPTPTAAG